LPKSAEPRSPSPSMVDAIDRAKVPVLDDVDKRKVPTLE
jgi:hypothetical protein